MDNSSGANESPRYSRGTESNEYRPPSVDTTSSSERRANSSSEQSILSTIRIVSFWSAIFMPFLYVPLLVTGLSTATDVGTFFVLVGLNLVFLYVGRSHRETDQ